MQNILIEFCHLCMTGNFRSLPVKTGADSQWQTGDPFELFRHVRKPNLKPLYLKLLLIAQT